MKQTFNNNATKMVTSSITDASAYNKQSAEIKQWQMKETEALLKKQKEERKMYNPKAANVQQQQNNNKNKHT